MKFLNFISVLIVSSAVNYVSARVSGWPPVIPNADVNNVNSTLPADIADDFTIIIPSDDYTIKDDITFTPPIMFVGKSSGEMVRCVGQRCVTFNTASSAITSMAVSGEYIFAGLSSGVMWRCSLHVPNACKIFNTASDPINALTITAGYIYAGLNSGKIWRCELDRADSCRNFHKGSYAVTSLGASDKYLFAGLSTGSILRCAKEINICAVLDVGTEPITALAVTGDYVYAVAGAKLIKKCNTAGLLHCLVWYISSSTMKSLSIFKKSMYVATESGFLSCKMGAWDACSEFNNMTGALSAVNIYGTFQLQTRVRYENKQCTWQVSWDPLICPPFVVYYDIKQRQMFEVFVRDGKVYNWRGMLLDSSQADFAHSGNATIFVMAPNGQIYASNNHKMYLLHHSSMLAGNPASAAGEMFVDQGVIKKITTCSGHYRSNLDLNKQLIDSLNMNGYTRKIDSQLCPVKMS